MDSNETMEYEDGTNTGKVTAGCECGIHSNND